ncbi:hypothetical protein [Sporosarcina obsidiansis]|uniref:hypothetical protein n=1 Tax=Sporosarcina obsidiansis TaxID=2660748 RepID=UPI00129A636D|nr:hypothetical protein [Sporosarcina obsidiansis]
MEFLYIVYHDNSEVSEGRLHEQTCKKVHQAPIEHQIVEWLRRNLELFQEKDQVQYYNFPKEKVELFYNILSEAHAEKSKDTPRPWKYLPIPDDDEYPYMIAEYEKEYGSIYYESLYKYITALGVILNIFDFENNQLLVFIQ